MKNKTKKKKVTIDDLAEMISAGTRETKKFVGKEIENLAGMVQRGFSSVDEEFSKVNKQLSETAKQSDLEDVKKEVVSMKEDFRRILNSLDAVAKNYAAYSEDIKLRDVEMKRLKKWIEQIAEKIGVKLEN